MVKKAIVGLLLLGALIWIGEGRNGKQVGETGAAIVDQGVDSGGGIADAVTGFFKGLRS